MCKNYLDEKEIEEYLDYITSGSVTIASYVDYGIDVTLFYGKDPTIVVTQDDIIIYSCAIYKENLEEKLGYVEDEFLTEHGVVRNFLDMYSDEYAGYNYGGYDDDDDEYDYGYNIPYGYSDRDKIEDREDELDLLIYNFIDGATDGEEYDKITDEVMQDCKEHFLEYLYTKHGIQAYRPMVLCDEMGKEAVFDFPYAYVYGEA